MSSMTNAKHLHVPVLLAGLALASLPACGTKPTDDEYDDVASSTAALVSDEPGSEGESASDAVRSARGQLPPAMTRMAEGHLHGRRASLDYDFELTCSDAQGAVVASCEGADRAHLTVSLDGQLETTRRSATVHREGDWTLVGLTTPEAQLDGTGSFHLEGDFHALVRPVTRSYTYDYAARYEAVKIATATGQLEGGRATYDITADRTVSRANRKVERHLDITAEVTFLGNGRARIVLDGDRTYDVTLADGTATRAR